MTTGVGEVDPTPVVGNASPTHVMTNGEVVTVGVVGVLLEHAADSMAMIDANAATFEMECLSSLNMLCPVSGDLQVFAHGWVDFARAGPVAV
jgi:hypothetical protein